eukprot:1300914-Pleurochrysis_carterae.AAC.1
MSSCTTAGREINELVGCARRKAQQSTRLLCLSSQMVQMKRNRQMRSPCPERPSITRPWNLSSEEAPPLSRQSSPVSKPHDTDAGAQAQLPGPHAHAQPQPRDTPHNVPLTPLLQTLPANKSSAQRSVTANAVQPSVTSRPYTAGCTNPAACANAADTYPVATHQPGGYAGNYLPEAGACSRNVGGAARVATPRERSASPGTTAEGARPSVAADLEKMESIDDGRGTNGIRTLAVPGRRKHSLPVRFLTY